MSRDMRWESYLYENHPPERLLRWTRTLAYFRFCRAYGGHNNDGDQLLVALRDPAAVRSSLGLAPVEQPGWVTLAGQLAHVWTYEHKLTISVSDRADIYAVTETAVAAALKIEPLLAPLADLVIDPPQTDRNCFSPHTYPSLFRAL